MIHFFVPGIPKTAGSKKAFLNKRTMRAIVTDDCSKGKAWRSDLVNAAQNAYDGPPLRGPIDLHVVFRLPRPKGHFGRSGNVLPRAPKHHITKPDQVKLLRAVEDAFQGLLWIDDNQVVHGAATKVYADDGRTGADVQILQLEG